MHDSGDLELIKFDREMKFRNRVWDECQNYTGQGSTVDYCKFLFKVGQIYELLREQVKIEQYDAVIEILIKDLNNDNDKIISWEVLDFF